MSIAKCIAFASIILCLIIPVAVNGGEVDVKGTKLYCESVKTPLYRSAEESVTDHWGRFVFKFDVKDSGNKDGWINEMDVVWKIAVTDSSKKTRVLSRKVTYQDIEEGNGHRVCVYLKPGFMKRYMGTKNFSKLEYSLYVSILVNGREVESMMEMKSKHNDLPKDWYRSEGDKARSSQYFLPKSKTPFAGMDYDFYEDEKVE